MTPDRHGSAHIELPNDLDIVLEANYDNVEDYLRSLLDAKGTVSG